MRTGESVTVRPSKHRDYPGGFVVRWPGKNGKRLAKLFGNETEALAWAKDRRAELGDVGLKFGAISEEERAAVVFWRGFEAEAREASPPALLKILQEYAETWRMNRSSVSVAFAFKAYEAAKKAEGLRPLSLQGIKTRCGRFAREFGDRPISTFTSAQVSDYLLSLMFVREPKRPAAKLPGNGKGGDLPEPVPLSLMSKRCHRSALSGMFTFAKARGWVNVNPVTDAARPKPKKVRPAIVRAGDVGRLFAALEVHAPQLVPFWALRFFAGIREQECLRMDWSMIDLESREIHIHDTVAKTGHSRTVQIEDALAAFLSPYAKEDGRIVRGSATGRGNHLLKALSAIQAEEEAARAAGEEVRAFPVPMPANAARHTFATCHLLAFRHAGETSIQLGHGGSPAMLHRHYKGITTEAEAKRFWEIRPAGNPANLIPTNGPPVMPGKPSHGKATGHHEDDSKRESRA